MTENPQPASRIDPETGKKMKCHQPHEHQRVYRTGRGGVLCGECKSRREVEAHQRRDREQRKLLAEKLGGCSAPDGQHAGREDIFGNLGRVGGATVRRALSEGYGRLLEVRCEAHADGSR